MSGYFNRQMEKFKKQKPEVMIVSAICTILIFGWIAVKASIDLSSSFFIGGVVSIIIMIAAAAIEAICEFMQVKGINQFRSKGSWTREEEKSLYNWTVTAMIAVIPLCVATVMILFVYKLGTGW